MVDREKLLVRLMATFLDELDEHVETLNTGVLALEKGLPEGGGKEQLSEMFRAAHSLKGASRAVDQESIEQLCHVLEDVFGGIRDGTLKPEPALCTLMLTTADAISAAGQSLRAKEPINAALLKQLRATVSAAAAGEPYELPGKQVPAPLETSPSEQAAQRASEVSTHAPVVDQQPTVSAPTFTAPRESIRGESAQNERTQQQASPTLAPASSVTSEVLTSAFDLASPVLTQEAAAVVTPRQPVKPEQPHKSSTVRVTQEKLDLLLAQSGELLVARQSIDAHPVEIEALLHSVSNWKLEWQTVERSLTRLIENNGHDPLVSRSDKYATKLAQTVEANGERLQKLERSLEQLRRQTLTDARQLNTVGSAVHDEVHGIRMVPFEEACAGLERIVRDIATTAGKEVELVIQGGDIEVDRSVITGLTDPLIHLVRNAVDHGIESSEDRSTSGKPAVARVCVSASLRGSQVEVTVSDDGKGLDAERIREKVRKRGLPEPSDDRELLNCIFLPGFSTAEMITDVSGRGIGMDVVKSQVERLRGSIELGSQVGLGTRVTMLVPLTLTTINAVFVTLGTQPFLLPSVHVRTLVRFLPADIQRVRGQDTLSVGEAPLPVVMLGQLIGCPAAPQSPGRLTGVIATAGGREVILVVDEVTSEREIVVKNLGPRIHRLPHVSGATLLQSGGIGLLLNVPSLVRSATAGNRSTTINEVPSVETVSATASRIIVVDDSVTTRTLLRSILESAGYDVEGAVDGQDAWDRMQASSTGFDLVVSDVDMPRMNGFELTKVLRSDNRYTDTPVVLVTSRDSEEDKTQGVRSGANAYLVKSQFDQSNVLETVEQLI